MPTSERAQNTSFFGWYGLLLDNATIVLWFDFFDESSFILLSLENIT